MMMMGSQPKHNNHHHHQPSSQQQQQPSTSSQKISFISCGRGYPEDGGDFDFVSPPEAPIFRPTEEEFAAGPLEYIARIKPLAEPFGICKIVPPASFKPKFAVNAHEFTFTPRVQRLNELEALTRIKLNFLEQVIKFWDLQGALLKIPSVDKRPIDLHLLHKVVQEEGGFESCTRERKWSRVALRLGYNTSRQNKGPVASLLRQHYERILFPYDVFLSGATIVEDVTSSASCSPTPTDGGVKRNCPDAENSSEDSDKKQLRSSPRRMTRRSVSSSVSSSPNGSNLCNNKELRKLKVHGAGPKMPGVSLDSSSSLSLNHSSSSSEQNQREKETNNNV